MEGPDRRANRASPGERLPRYPSPNPSPSPSPSPTLTLALTRRAPTTPCHGSSSCWPSPSARPGTCRSSHSEYSQGYTNLYFTMTCRSRPSRPWRSQPYAYPCP
eukprot:scaffold101945_cov24-Phaeocystis_antarctica.AAC.1